MSGEYGFWSSHTLSQWEDSINFKDINRSVENCDVSSEYGTMNIHTDLQQNCLESLMNDNYSNDTNMNDTSKNGDVIIEIGLLNSHTLPQDNE